MDVTRWWRRVWLVSLLGCTLLLGAGCEGGSSAGGGISLPGTSRLVLQISTPNTVQGRAVLPTSSAQTRAENDVARIRAEVSGVGIGSPIVVECSIAVPLTPECQITITATTITAVITLTVPSGTRRLVTITAFDQNGAIILRGQQLIDLNQPLQTLSLGLNPQTGSIGTTLVLRGQTDDGGDSADTTAWVLLSQPPESEATIFDASTHHPTFLLDRSGVYLFQLEVSEAQLVEGERHIVLTAASPVVTWVLLAQPPDSAATLMAASAQASTLVVDTPGSYVVQAIVSEDDVPTASSR